MASLRIDPRDKPGLLIAAMRAFEGSGQISFEGDLHGTRLNELAGSTHGETDALRRATLTPQLDFIVAPLTSENIAAIWKVVVDGEHLAYPSGIIHVQIAVGNRFVFGAYDNFHRDCVVATEQFPVDVLDRLVANGVIRAYAADADDGPIVVGRTSVPT